MTGSEDDPESTDVGIYFAELAYKRGLENIEAQNRQIDDIRRRSLGISGVTVTLSLFLFQSGLENGARVMSYIGIIALIVSSLLAVTVFYLILPKPGWRRIRQANRTVRPAIPNNDQAQSPLTSCRVQDQGLRRQ